MEEHDRIFHPERPNRPDQSGNQSKIHHAAAADSQKNKKPQLSLPLTENKQEQGQYAGQTVAKVP